MKHRQGWVSNSSTSSFLVMADLTKVTKPELIANCSGAEWFDDITEYGLDQLWESWQRSVSQETTEYDAKCLIRTKLLDMLGDFLTGGRCLIAQESMLLFTAELLRAARKLSTGKYPMPWDLVFDTPEATELRSMIAARVNEVFDLCKEVSPVLHVCSWSDETWGDGAQIEDFLSTGAALENFPHLRIRE